MEQRFIVYFIDKISTKGIIGNVLFTIAKEWIDNKTLLRGLVTVIVLMKNLTLGGSL